MRRRPYAKAKQEQEQLHKTDAGHAEKKLRTKISRHCHSCRTLCCGHTYKQRQRERAALSPRAKSVLRLQSSSLACGSAVLRNSSYSPCTRSFSAKDAGVWNCTSNRSVRLRKAR